MGKIIAIHQPNYLPWIGYFHKIFRSNIFVFLDDVEYNSWVNRNKIKTPEGWTWLIVPMKSSTFAKITEIEIDNSKKWREKHWKSIQRNYGKADHFDDFEAFLNKTYRSEWNRLCKLNMHLIEEISKFLNLELNFVKSSELNIKEKGSERLVRICEEVGGSEYLSGGGAKGYLKEELFEKAGIELSYQNFDYPEYKQRFGDFIPNLSFIDVLLNVGSKKARKIIETL